MKRRAPRGRRLTPYQKRKVDFALSGIKPVDLILSEKKAPPLEVPQRGLGLLPPGYLQVGYGRVKYWPFSVKVAVENKGYRWGVIRATKNPAFNDAWRGAADYLLNMVYEILSKNRPLEEIVSDYPEGTEMYIKDKKL